MANYEGTQIILLIFRLCSTIVNCENLEGLSSIICLQVPFGLISNTMTFKYFKCNLSVTILFRGTKKEMKRLRTFLWQTADNKTHQDGVGILKTHRRLSGDPHEHTQNILIRKHTDPSIQLSIKTVQRVNIQIHHTRMTYQRSSVTQAWW